jgi:hypothetical protein
VYVLVNLFGLPVREMDLDRGSGEGLAVVGHQVR